MTEQLRERQSRNIKRLGKVGAIMAGAAVAFGGLNFAKTEAVRADEPASSPSITTPEVNQAAAPEVSVSTFSLGVGEHAKVLPGDIIAGDVAMAEYEGGPIRPLYDQDTYKANGVEDNTKTALYVNVVTEGELYAPYGAFVTRGLAGEQKDTWIQLQSLEKTRAGFTKVDIVTWRGYEPTVDQAGFTADRQPGTVTETQTNLPETNVDVSTNYPVESDKAEALLAILLKSDIDWSKPENESLFKLLLACICRCEPGEQPEPTEKPKPTPKPEEPCVPMNDHLLKPGQTFTVRNGKDFIVQGDVLINGRRTYDNSEKTGAVSWITNGQTNTIKAPYGADVQVFDNCATRQDQVELYNSDLKELRATGRKLDSNSIKN